jgi:hypothetical protein
MWDRGEMHTEFFSRDIGIEWNIKVQCGTGRKVVGLIPDEAIRFFN